MPEDSPPQNLLVQLGAVLHSSPTPAAGTQIKRVRKAPVIVVPITPGIYAALEISPFPPLPGLPFFPGTASESPGEHRPPSPLSQEHSFPHWSGQLQ